VAGPSARDDSNATYLRVGFLSYLRSSVYLLPLDHHVTAACRG